MPKDGTMRTSKSISYIEILDAKTLEVVAEATDRGKYKTKGKKKLNLPECDSSYELEEAALAKGYGVRRIYKSADVTLPLESDNMFAEVLR